MCGLTGIFDTSRRRDDSFLRDTVSKMTATLVHRGPDDGGIWVDAAAGIALGHRRLSILDLSPAGHQPMVSASGRFVAAYNGEIYNHQELRRELMAAGHLFRGGSDTETLLAALEEWGVEGALTTFNGMFAFAVWDSEQKSLILARDRIGIKPLYYGWIGQQLVFASELKAIRKCSDFSATVDREALSLFLQHNYIPAPYSIYEGIRKLPPGTFITIDHSARAADVHLQRYWDLEEVVSVQPTAWTEASALEALENLLRDSVLRRMAADVPLGAFLSGGIDSTAAVALAQSQSDRAIQTFTIGFEDPKYDESAYAAAIAKHLKTQHTSLIVTSKAAQAIVPLLPTIYDEPFADSSQLPTFLVSQLARESVTVALTGDGGDELFGGYDRYFRSAQIWRKLSWMAPGLRAALSGIIKPMQARLAVPQKLATLASFIDSNSFGEFYSRFHSHWKDPGSVICGGRVPMTLADSVSPAMAGRHLIEEMMFIDTRTYLPDDILAKVDRASMGVSLEARVPFLDHRMLEFAWSLPMEIKCRGGKGKSIVRELVEKHVPAKLLDRPKVGFGVPIDAWLRGPLRDWAESLLDERRLVAEGFFRPQPIREKWSEHLSGKRDWHYYLWDVLMFQAWLETAGK